MAQAVHISILAPAAFDARMGDLASLLLACVEDGASVNFILPFTEPQALAYWEAKVRAPVQSGARIVWIAETGGRIVGTVQLDIDTPPNQPHRAEVTKLLVHPEARRQGIARRLMQTLEAHAAGLGRTLLTLDTRTGDKAEPLYSSLGFVTVGTIPRFCRDTIEERWDATTLMYKHLDAA
ncbi:GNAT family N-acetyltransferase [Amorphus orientalis]|uniref:Ribosomal protein S18 acetylase RimI-like enzyme n=1 Tax=Amorphus orientalis TaxID=649198 RepID=A0AAE3VT12_9HYPH|nr:GNAT family N-acetyltransferase [Amorphus orientalis]MDQ0317061.1 ribosomal protein S18 acetylase RimI-like enzyme [Amorphus orientalis]